MPDDGLTKAIAQAERRQVSVRALLLGTGPPFARDAIGPVAAFYLGWKFVNLATGIVAAAAMTVAAYIWERRQARSGLAAAIGLSIALVQALVGLASGSAKSYFAPPVIANASYGHVSGTASAGSAGARAESVAAATRTRPAEGRA